MTITNNTFICQLASLTQDTIKSMSYNYLENEGLEEDKINETIENIMDDRVWNISDVITLEEIKSLEIYNSIISTLQSNDRNATFDEILQDCEYDMLNAVTLLKDCLTRLVNEEDIDMEMIEFYQSQLDNLMLL